MRPAEEATVSSACFGHVSRRLSRLFRRLPKSRSWSEGLRLLRRSSSSGALVVSDCSYTCHLDCENYVRLDCNQGNRQKDETPTASACRTYSTAPPEKGPLEAPQMTGSNSMSSGYCSLDEENDECAFFTAKTTFFRRAQTKQRDKNTTKEDEEEKQQALTEEEVKTKIEEYNAQVSENGMKLAADGTYNGFIKVHLKLRRPVTLLSNDENSSATADISDKRTSFYLPSESVKQLHVSSHHGQRSHRGSAPEIHDLFQKLPDSEHPLCLRLLAGPDLGKLSFVLKENETEEVEWHAFSVPELQNFLAILEKEERERVKQVEQRYTTYRKKLIEALEESQNNPG
ncbi:Ras association domain-containing protein 5 [Bagarius yarrelli]|uniref:Ras association domain-containing protein 5 n=1 Tax=Bagarius yarrelli TaxID=175774 RepID=A0A556V8Z8_BAGYA|nr:Ras association domain-containing protein 5 [Bagarius yarrelli]